MKYVKYRHGDGGWWVPDRDTYFAEILARDGTFHKDRFDALIEAHRNQHSRTRGQLVLDVGAHVGTWSVFFVAERYDVVAFEPDYETYLCLLKNISKFKTGSHTVSIHAAVGNRKGRTTLVDDPSRPGNTGASYMTWPPKDRYNHVPVLRLDDHLDWFEKVAILKIDVEGAEHLVVEGAKELISRDKPTILVEVKKGFGRRYDIEDGYVLSLLAALGYREVARLGGDRILVPN